MRPPRAVGLRLAAAAAGAACALALAGLAASRSESGGVATDERALLSDPAQALRSALELAARGEASAALDRLARCAERFPIVADHADLLRVRLLVRAERPAEANAAAVDALARHPDSPLRPELLRRLGEIRAASGDEAAARSAWSEALRVTDDDTARASLELAIADSHERSGAREAAAEGALRVWRDHPAAPAAEAAAQRLSRLEPELPRPLRTGADWRRRADRLFAVRRNASALAAYEAALAGELAEPARRHARVRRARCLFHLRRYTEAAAAFGALGAAPDVRLWHARALARTGDTETAVRRLEALSRDQAGHVGAQAAYTAGLLLEAPEDAARAAANFERAARRAPGRGLRVDALWQLAWLAYRAGERPEALRQLDALLRLERDPVDALRARYWRGRALEPADPDAARQALGAIAAEFPLSYYGWRAAARGAEVARPEPALEEGEARLPPRALQRARILIGAGLVKAARSELLAMRARAGGLEDRLELARLLRSAKAPGDSVQVIEKTYADTLLRGPVPGREDLWRLAWPRPYAARVEVSLAKDARIGPELVYAIMREESRYRPDALSSVGARGLMQIMPETGERLAEQRALTPFHPDDLFLPSVNILLGTHYLEELARRFEGRLAAAIGSYNAGPQAVARWLSERPDWPEDEWVEAIPYRQTRRYVKRVLRSLHAYRVLAE